MMRVTASAAVLAGIFAVACTRAGSVDELYTVESKASPPELVVGGRGTVQVDVKTREGAHLSDEAPLKLSVTGRGVKVESPQLSRADARPQPDGTRFQVPFVAESAGAGAVEGEVVFFICTDKLCERQSRKVSVPVQVK